MATDSMAESSAVNCSHFEKFDEFYFIRLRNETGFNMTILEQCRIEICLALFGTGFPDISGVGVGSLPSGIQSLSIILT